MMPRRGAALALSLLAVAELSCLSIAQAQNSGLAWTNWLAGTTNEITLQATNCGDQWGLRTSGGTGTGYYSLTESTSFYEAYGPSKALFKTYKPRVGSYKRWVANTDPSESNTPAALKSGLPIWQSWDIAGFSVTHQKKIALQILSMPAPANVEYLVIVCGGTQKRAFEWPGNAAAMTGSVADYHMWFNEATATNQVPLYKESFAYQVFKGADLPMSKTLFVNILDNGIPGLDQTLDEKQDNMLGWRMFLDKLIYRDTTTTPNKWPKIKAVVVAGMSRGACWVLQFLGNYIKHLVPTTTKFIIETDEAVCDPQPGFWDVNGNFEYLDTTKVPYAGTPTTGGNHAYDVVGNAKVSSNLEAQNPTTSIPATGNYKCKKAQLNQYLCPPAQSGAPCTPRENICWLNTVGGQNIVNNQHRALCHDETTSVWNTANSWDYYANPLAPGTGPDKATFLKQANGLTWYHQRWVPWSHCIVGRSAFQTKTPNTHYHHYKQCLTSMGINQSAPTVLGYKQCQGWTAPQCVTVGNMCKLAMKCTGYGGNTYSATTLPNGSLAYYTSNKAGPFFPDCTTSSCYGYVVNPAWGQTLPTSTQWDVSGFGNNVGQIITPGFGMELQIFSLNPVSCGCTLPPQISISNDGYIYTPNQYPPFAVDPTTYEPNPFESGSYQDDVYPLPPLVNTVN